MAKINVSPFDSLIRVAITRGEVSTRLDKNGVDITFRLPRDLVNDEILQAILKTYTKGVVKR
jgi:hypothetical protein